MQTLSESLCHIATLLSDHLSIYYTSMEKLVEVGSAKPQPGTEAPNKIILTLLNIERETAVGAAVAYRSQTAGSLSKTAVPWYFNLFFVMAAVFEGKRYVESVEKLGTAIGFLQQCNTLTLPDMSRIIIEPVTVNIQELNNIWSMMGGQHYPSFLGKIRLVAIDSGQVDRTVPRISRPENR